MLDTISAQTTAAPNHSIGYGFTIGASGVTGINLVVGDRTIPLSIRANETYTVDSVAGTVKSTLTNSKAIETTVYSKDAVNPAVYHVLSKTTTLAAPTTTTAHGSDGYSFITTGGVITGMQEVTTHNTTTKTHAVHVLPTTVFSGTIGGTITGTSVEGNSIITTTYVQSVANGLYAEQSHSVTFIPAATATTLLNIEPDVHLNFAISNNAVTHVQVISPTGVATDITPHSGVAFQEVIAGNQRFIEETFTSGSHSSFKLFMQSTANGTYMEIAHGSGTTIDLVGINDQLSHVPAANLALI